ncbi:MAG: class I SAM-dependent methyltransferase [Oscillospiraceae bacterium]|nr:class I SAM-dependent methyltransferase [Oscillospiraceae bacterium]
MFNGKKDMDFGKRASKYDGFEGRISYKFYHLLLAQINLVPDTAILDVGCGTGTMLRKMADNCRIKGYGIDIAPNMIEEAKRKCPEMIIQYSRCEQTPFNDSTFDILTTCMAYHHFSDKKGFAKEAARILKPGGCLYIADPNFPYVIRKLLNGVFNGLHISAGFYKPEKIFNDFAEYGFIPDGYVKDGYAQVVKMKLEHI